jgi:hypothetical protein
LKERQRANEARLRYNKKAARMRASGARRQRAYALHPKCRAEANRKQE